MQQNVIDMYEAPFSLYDANPGLATDVALQRSIGLQLNDTSAMFFSQQNVDRLQRRLQLEIRKRMGYSIDRQSDDQLVIVMRYVYMQSGANEGGMDEVQRLNELVLAEIVPQVGAGLAQFVAYLKDASTLPTPIPRGTATSIKGSKTTELFRPL